MLLQLQRLLLQGRVLLLFARHQLHPTIGLLGGRCCGRHGLLRWRLLLHVLLTCACSSWVCIGGRHAVDGLLMQAGTTGLRQHGGQQSLLLLTALAMLYPVQSRHRLLLMCHHLVGE